MAKIIFTSSYMKDTPPAHLENYVRYISTREGVDKIDISKSHLSATKSQKRLVKQLLQEIPEKYESDEPAIDRGRSLGNKWWSREYKLARQYLYGSGEVVQDFSMAYHLFLQEAEAGNALAMYDLGRMSADSLGCDTDREKAQEWYTKALAAFLGGERDAQERQRPYLQYRIGKIYLTGLGTEQDYEHAFRLYQRSAEQGDPYAEYELAKMYRDGIGAERNQEAAEEHYKNAFNGFTDLESRSHDDKL